MQSESEAAGDNNNTPKRSNAGTLESDASSADTNQQKRMRIVSTVVAHNAIPCREEHAKASQIADMLEQTLDDGDQQPTTKESLLVLAKTIRQTLHEIAEIKERNHERRHRELMQLLEKYLQNDADDDTRPHKAEAVATEKERNPAETHANTQETQTHTCPAEEQLLVELSSPEHEIVVPTSYDAASSSSSSSVVQVDESHIIVETIDDELLVEMPPPSVEEAPTSPMPRCISQSIVVVPNIIIPPPPKPLAMKPTPPNEFLLMREQMLEMQRRKMADRERKKQMVQKKLMDKLQR